MPASGTEGPLAVLVAVREEYAAIRRGIAQPQAASLEPLPALRGTLHGRCITLARSGMGQTRSASAARTLLCTVRPSALLIAGFCAALAPDVRPGDLVLADSLLCADGRVLHPGRDLATTPDRELGFRVHRGPIVTVDDVVTTAEAKRDVRARWNALSVDNESAVAALEAERAGVPWAAVRAVTDGADDDMPLPFGRYVGRDGEPDRWRIVLAVLVRPWLAPGLIRLGVRSARAAGNLAAFVEAYVRSL